MCATGALAAVASAVAAYVRSARVAMICTPFAAGKCAAAVRRPTCGTRSNAMRCTKPGSGSDSPVALTIGIGSATATNRTPTKSCCIGRPASRRVRRSAAEYVLTVTDSRFKRHMRPLIGCSPIPTKGDCFERRARVARGRKLEFRAWSGTGPVAQLVFKTGEVWQPHAGSVRLRGRSVQRKRAGLRTRRR